jgi:NAD-specific glutamate dehydrogenase
MTNITLIILAATQIAQAYVLYNEIKHLNSLYRRIASLQEAFIKISDEVVAVLNKILAETAEKEDTI